MLWIYSLRKINKNCSDGFIKFQITDYQNINRELFIILLLNYASHSLEKFLSQNTWSQNMKHKHQGIVFM